MLDIEFDLAAHVGIPPDPARESSVILYWHSRLSKERKEQEEKEKRAQQKQPSMIRR